MRVLTLFACVVFVGCTDPVQKQLTEVNRLEALKAKMGEVVQQQQENIAREIVKFNSVQSEIETKILETEALIETYKEKIPHLENWHVVEERKRMGKAQVGKDGRLSDMRVKLTTKKYLLESLQHELKQAPSELEEAMQAKEKAIVGVNYLSVLDVIKEKRAAIANLPKQIADLKMDIAAYQQSLEQLRSAALVYTKPVRRDEEIKIAHQALETLQLRLSNFAGELEKKKEDFRLLMLKMQTDLKVVKAAQDSLNALHTNAVFALSAMK